MRFQYSTNGSPVRIDRKDKISATGKRISRKMNIIELKTAVRELSQNELTEFLEWLEEFQENLWDQQIEKDLKAGKFDPLIRQAEQAFSQGKCREI